MAIKKGFVYYILSTLFISVLLFSYIVGDVAVQLMDFTGWLFFVLSCLSHSALVMFVVWLVMYLPWALLRLPRVGAVLLVTTTSLLAILIFLNMQVYHIYRFHINGMVLSMVMGEGASDIFVFSPLLYLKEVGLLALIALLCVGLWFVAVRLYRRFGKPLLVSSITLFLVSLLCANALHAYGAFVQKTSILQSVRMIPYYFPITTTRWLIKHGVVPPVPKVTVDSRSGGILNYPRHPLQITPPQQPATHSAPNILFLLIDSWNRRSLTPETMPVAYAFAQENEWFADHISSCNDTRYSVFTLFTGLQPYYYPAFEASHTSPLLVDRLLDSGYDFRVYPSSNILNPPFNRLLFQRVPNLRVETPGDNALERDQRIAADFVADLPDLKEADRPFFAFVFFDLPHSYDLPKDSLNRFLPTWEFADYARLTNDLDPTPFWNLYRHTCYQTDLLLGHIFQRLKELGMYDNTIILLTGDHSQEFNENRKNYWGHASNFSLAQIGVPLLVRRPGYKSRKYNHRTTHYDIPATLMHDYLNVTNPLEDYCAGHLLTDSVSRLWHFVGNELRNAFLVEGDTIIIKEGNGWMEVTDAHLNPVKDYHLNPRELDQAFKKLNSFYK